MLLETPIFVLLLTNCLYPLKRKKCPEVSVNPTGVEEERVRKSKNKCWRFE